MTLSSFVRLSSVIIVKAKLYCANNVSILDVRMSTLILCSVYSSVSILRIVNLDLKGLPLCDFNYFIFLELLNYQKLWKQLWEFSLDFRLLVTADLTPRYLSAYIPILSTSSFTSV